LIIGNILSQPLWVSVSKKKDKKVALVLAIFITTFSVFGVILVFIFRINLINISFYLIVTIMLVCGIGSGGLYTLPSAIYGDTIMCIDGGERKIATYTGTLTFASNIANSITQLIVGILLDVIKFDSNVQIQTLYVQTGLALILFIGVQASLISACFIFSQLLLKKK
jgi:Na+/melibiose symporter-like transporter